MAIADALTLRAAMARAQKRSSEALQRSREAVALMKQRSAAAESLWAGGHAAEGLSMAREAYEAASAAVAVARGGETGQSLDRAALFRLAGVHEGAVAAAESAYAAPRPMLDDEVSYADATRVKTMLKVVRQAERALVDDVRSVADVRAGMVRRVLSAVTVLVLLVGGMSYWLKERSAEANAAWIGRYYPRTNFGGEAERTHESELDFDWGATSPMMAIPADHFSARFDACLSVPTDQVLRIGLGSDDGSRVFVDDHSVVDNWRAQAYTWKNGEIQLSAGMHHVRVEYFEGAGNAKLQVQFNSGDSAFDGVFSRPSAPDNGCGERAASNPAAEPSTMAAVPTPSVGAALAMDAEDPEADGDAEQEIDPAATDGSEMSATPMTATPMTATPMTATMTATPMTASPMD